MSLVKVSQSPAGILSKLIPLFYRSKHNMGCTVSLVDLDSNGVQIGQITDDSGPYSLTFEAVNFGSLSSEPQALRFSCPQGSTLVDASGQAFADTSGDCVPLLWWSEGASVFIVLPCLVDLVGRSTGWGGT